MVVVPHVPGMLRAQTYEAIRQAVGDDSFLRPHRPGGFHYPELLRQLWHQPGDLVIAEQDMVPGPGDIERLLACEHDWCGHQTDYLGHSLPETHSLVKYSARLRDAHPELCCRALTRNHWNPSRGLRWYRGPNLWPDGQEHLWPTDVPWLYAADNIARELRDLGYAWHEHRPEVRHLHWDPEPVYWPTLPGRG